jgi:hypothetical protein
VSTPAILTIVAVVIATAAIGVAIWLATTARRTRDVLERQLRDEQIDLAETQRSVEHLETRMTTLRAELAEAHRENAELTDRLRIASSGDGRGIGLLALERHRQARAAGTPLVAPMLGPGTNLADELRTAIDLQLELLREEVGTYGELVDWSVPGAVDAVEALATLRIVEELAAALAKRSSELAVTVTREAGMTVVAVDAEGWNDPVPEPRSLEQALAALDATLDLTAADGTLHALARLRSRDQV